MIRKAGLAVTRIGGAGVLCARDRVGGRVPTWNRGGVQKAEANNEAAVTAGDVIDAVIARAADFSSPDSRR